MKMASVSNDLIAQLQRSCTLFGEGQEAQKLHLLRELSKLKLNNPRAAIHYHQCLQFILGYGESEALHQLARQEMERIAEEVKKWPAEKRAALDRSGVPFSETQGAYSFVLVRWMLQAFPGQVALHSFDEGGAHPGEVYKPYLPEMEFELTSDDSLKPLKWLEKAAGSKNKNELLAWMIRHLDHTELNDSTKDQLFESMSVFVNIKPVSGALSKGLGNFFLHENFYHPNGLVKRFDEQELIRRKLPSPKKLSITEKETIIEKARVALLLLNRETDPVTYCSGDGLLFYELEHGLSIALFSMLPEKRLPLESYIGFMMFKNGYPMAYGGGWLFGDRSLLGINIFEAFRGGESAFVFCQLLRTYRQSFGADYFEVEPYQFGKGNPEGIQSGAFWFYYRFGFRPLDGRLHALAQKETEIIASKKGYRTSAATLKEFTHSNIAAHFGNGETPVNPSKISRYISEQIVTHHNGDRLAAEKWCVQKLKLDLGLDRRKLGKAESIGFDKLLFFVAMCLKTENLSVAKKEKVKEWMLEKGRSEYSYIGLCKEIGKMLVDEVKK